MTDKPTPENHFSIQKLYVKDISFESPDTPAVFTFKNWEPKIELNMNNSNKKVSEGVYEVILSVTSTVKNNDKTAFLVEVQQAGIFNISGFNEQDLKYLLGSQCMNILFPYLREVISDLTGRGGFPPLLLSPVNFDALYAQAVQKQQEAAASPPASDVKH